MSVFNFLKDFISKFRPSDANDKDVFDHYFFDLKYYLQKYDSVEHFAQLLNSKPEKINQISFDNYACSCELLISEYRYKQFLEELESPLNSSLTLESLLKISGFENNKQFIDFVQSKKSCSHSVSHSTI